MRRALRLGFLACALPVLLGGTCPTPPLPPRPLLEAPRFIKSTVVAEFYEQRIQEFVYLEWEAPDTDSVSLSEYVILPSIPFDTTIDSQGIFQVDNPRLPGERTFTYQRSADIRKSLGRDLTVYYRVFAIDEFERAGDTSAACTVSLARKAELAYPRDTLSEHRFEWTVYDVANWYHTNLVLYSDTSGVPLFTSDTSRRFGGNFQIDNYTVTGAPTLAAGMYYWAARLEIPSPSPGAVSFTIGSFYVP